MKRIVYIIILLALTIPISMYAEEGVDTVSLNTCEIQIYAQGDYFYIYSPVALNYQPGEGQPPNYFWYNLSDPGAKELLAFALLAQENGQNVRMNYIKQDRTGLGTYSVFKLVRLCLLPH